MSIDNSTAIVARSAGVRRLARAALLAGMIALGANTLGHSGIASAEWDIEAYDNCMAQPHIEDPHHPYHAVCCVSSGGIVDGEGRCRAPVDLTAPSTPLGPKLNLGQPSWQTGPPTNTLGAPVS
ncbi:MAG TPA: hypothetical protein VFB19_01720 [Mycobacterium sp.]|nr:hypothetical protein [Mycobacterium sp.]